MGSATFYRRILSRLVPKVAQTMFGVPFQISGPSTALFYPHIAVGASGWNRLYLVYFETHTWREPCPNILLQCSVQL